MARPRVAVIATTYFKNSHADVCATRLIEGYPYNGSHRDARVDVVAMYLEQLGDHDGPKPRPDIGVDIAARNGVPLFPTVAEAIGRGRGGVNVDGVVIIGEHGDYERNEFGQQLYPRRRLFDAAVSTMIGAGRTVPIFTDKHLAWSFTDAKAMYDTARRLDIPVLAGSSVPLAWRIPTGTQWPFTAPMTDIVVAGYGPTERYGIHIIEALQAFAERRAGGETGIASVQALAGADARRAITDGTVDPALLDTALGTFDLDEAAHRKAKDSVKDVFLLEYVDGLRGAAVNCDEGIRNFGVAARGPSDHVACQIWLQPPPHNGHFIRFARQVESLLLDRAEPYPVERTLLTTGVLDVAMHSRHNQGERRQTPELAITYQAREHVPDTCVDLPLPGAVDAPA